MLAGLLFFAGAAAPAVVARVGSETLLLDQSEEALSRAHGTWGQMFNEHGFAERFPLLFWVVALVVVGAVGLPYVWLACQTLADRGFALARPVGLLLVTWVVWWLGSLRLVAFTRGAIALALVLTAAGAAAIVIVLRTELAAWVRARWRLLLVEEALFWSVFGGFLFVRWLNSDLWHPTLGGEKPMDLAYLNAVLKSSHFPPFDPWFAGGQMNYYYLGFVLVGVLVKATSIAPAVAYNLAVPTLAALLAAATFCVTLSLAHRRGPRASARLPTAAAVLGAVFVTVLGNLGELRVLANAIRGSIPIEWWYWNPTRVIHHHTTEPGLITEFPSFTYLYADLHPHAIALPFAACALALALALVCDGHAEARRSGRILLYSLLALVVGALWAVNTWDVPTYACIAVAALVVDQRRRRRARAAIGRVALGVPVFLAGAYLLYLPFHLHYAGVFDGIAVWHGSRTRLVDYLTIHGLFLFVIASALMLDLWTSRDANGVVRSARLALRSWDRIRRVRALHRALVRPSRAHRVGARTAAASLLLAAALAAFGLGVPAVVVALGTLAILALVRRRERAPSGRAVRQFAILLVLVGLGITLAVEFLVARNIDVGRTNTVFKTYLQVWVLWGVTAAALVADVYERLPRLPRMWRASWRVTFVCLLGIGALYPILAARAKAKDRFDTSVGATLDGMAFMTRAVTRDHNRDIPLVYDREAIRWVQRTVKGSPVFAEVNTYPTLYSWGNRFAMFTGNPDVVGWDYHQRQQRPSQSALVTRRIGDVQRAYRTTDPHVAYEILRRYGVSYVVVGGLERAYFPAGETKWDKGDDSFWTLAYANPGVRIYRLKPR